MPPQHTHTRTSHHAAPATPARTRAAGVARDAAVRAPQLRHAPHQQISHRRGARFRGGQHRGVVPPGPKGWGVATPERNDATLARARRGREGETPHNPVRGPWWFLASDPARGHAPTRGDPSRNSRQRGAQAASRTRRAERSLGASNVSVSRDKQKITGRRGSLRLAEVTVVLSCRDA